MFSDFANKIFEESIRDYHIKDTVEQEINNPYPKNEIAHLLYRKNWIDTVQWHYEDIIRDPDIDPVAALSLKRQIDSSNQDRTDLVEYIDSYFFNKYKEVTIQAEAWINTESPAWAVDRLSILALKIYHMKEETLRENASSEHIAKCSEKLGVLNEQQKDLSLAIDHLLSNIEVGKVYMKTYRQMKMYNDEELNPILRGEK
ncbi:DUF4254 domain-containing protein [Eudoraea chungangensis]|uniref:DUF4254 domain-containing protein n=1 Tax=Eudoraea chungangensis TaxID=1481905 RepID=UPI0023EB1670|nr:DUF4254 domain-containing protein [Eudoraea chungangensis]